MCEGSKRVRGLGKVTATLLLVGSQTLVWAAGAQTTAPAEEQTGTNTSAPVGTALDTRADTASAKGDSNHYVIGPDDMLQITVWREPTLSGALPVRPDGMISLVLIGDLKAAGRTPMQLGQDITDRLKRYVQNPVVTVAVTADTSQRVYLVGEVGKVGPISLSPGMTPLQAISAAGGPSPYANLKHIYILRGTGATQQKIPFNYKQALKGDTRQSPVLLPGDTIVVP